MHRDNFPADSLGRRRYPAEFKQSLVAQSLKPGQSIAGVATRHGINPNLLHKWRAASEASPDLLPVQIVDTPVAISSGSSATTGQDNCRRISATLALTSGHHLELNELDPEHLKTLIEVLT